MKDADKAAWDAYVKDVAPLDKPEALSVDELPRPKISVTYEQPQETRRLDLHGFTMVEAHVMTMDFVTGSTERTATIVTGLSGAIKREFPIWLEKLTHIRLEEMPGGGAYRLHFRKRKK